MNILLVKPNVIYFDKKTDTNTSGFIVVWSLYILHTDKLVPKHAES